MVTGCQCVKAEQIGLGNGQLSRTTGLHLLGGFFVAHDRR